MGLLLRYVALACYRSTQSIPLTCLSPLVFTAARSSILAVLQDAIQSGYLRIIDHDGVYTFGHYTKGGNYVELRVMNEAFWRRLLM